ncbi:RagB/SusD family nutrient uptake outer membrane protein [Chitinophaga oryziterrae]|uniref:RagB/SusD family nutrient uptake outer membrane protein n=1 Tax=Chitinophaga oryziterrae TaxID=1031224 RepID=A0A6N8J6J4_9BACT|nr:RagB/SusD family nutrient uptake outer membrane protein [Chitinophaga oryziterrae]MVT40251.1 RagB/SusD family nutrient uptake outer membrane protein [Chitinophaga oryziterrae]
MNRNKYNSIFIISVTLLMIVLPTACKKFVEVDTPPTKISTESAYKDNTTATAVLTGIYARMSDNYFVSLNLPAISLYEELSADNLMMYDVNVNNAFGSFYQNALEPQYLTSGAPYWNNTFSIMYNINASIAALTGNTELKPAVSKRLLGEAYFLRAFCYFYLTNIFGDVPLILTTQYNENSHFARTPQADVYKQILADLAQAEGLLDNTYVATTDVTKISSERIRPNLGAVNALQARVYLYQKNYPLAEVAATKVISQSSIYSIVDLNSVFLKNSSETIWALQPVNNNFNTREGGLFILPNDGPNSDHPLLISPSLMNSFEPGDARKDNWINTVTIGTDTFPYPAKYKIGFADGSTTFDEYTIVFRLSEQYLIRAEARNEQGKTSDAIADLNILRTRSRAEATAMVPDPLPNLSLSLTEAQLRPLILKERRVELFTEWGHRWFDLQRTGNINTAMTAAEIYKGGTWLAYKALYPIPVSEILLNSALSQNPGYTN